VASRDAKLSRTSTLDSVPLITTLAFTQAVQTREAAMATWPGGTQDPSVLGKVIGSETVSASIVQITNVWHPIAPTYRSTLKVGGFANSMRFVAS
jgi:hypothetical protein